MVCIKPGVASGRPTPLIAAPPEPDEVAELLRAAEGSRYAPLFALLVHTGLRRGEALALALEWSDVDLTRGLLRVRGILSDLPWEPALGRPPPRRR